MRPTRDERGDEAVLDGGRAIFVGDETLQVPYIDLSTSQQIAQRRDQRFVRRRHGVVAQALAAAPI